MKKRTFLLPTILLSLALLSYGCKIVSFSAQNLFITVTIEETFNLNSNDNAYMDMATVDLSQSFNDVDLTNVKNVSITNVEVTIINNNTGAATTSSGSVLFNSLTAPFAQNALLASFMNVNLNAALNDPLTFTNQLAINQNGISSLETHAGSSPPPTLKFFLTGTVNNPPVDFEIILKVTLQLELQS